MLKVSNSRILRGRTYLQNGQQYDSWLPAGTYDVGEVVSLYRDRDCTEMSEGRELRRRYINNGEKWYIGEAVYQDVIDGRHEGAVVEAVTV